LGDLSTVINGIRIAVRLRWNGSRVVFVPLQCVDITRCHAPVAVEIECVCAGQARGPDTSFGRCEIEGIEERIAIPIAKCKYEFLQTWGGFGDHAHDMLLT
jgi:hypothetical protein